MSAFKILSLSLVFSKLIIMCLGFSLFVFLVLRFCLQFLFNLEHFQQLFLQIFVSVSHPQPLLFCRTATPMTCILAAWCSPKDHWCSFHLEQNNFSSLALFQVVVLCLQIYLPFFSSCIPAITIVHCIFISSIRLFISRSSIWLLLVFSISLLNFWTYKI